MRVDVRGLPRITDPYVTDRSSRQVSRLLHHSYGQCSLLLLVLVLWEPLASSAGNFPFLLTLATTYMQDENAELCLLGAGSQLLSRSFHVLLKLLNGIL